MPTPTSDATTDGIRINASAFFLPDESDADARRYVFGYEIVIVNEGDEPAQLLSRRWLIIDSIGREHEVEGAGVIGQTPRIEPGKSFEYKSFCPLKTPWGTMEGSFTMRRDDGQTFEARINRFYLTMPAKVEAVVARRG